MFDLCDFEAFAELPLTFAQRQGRFVRSLGDAPWSAPHDYGHIFYYPTTHPQAHIQLRHHLIGFEFEPGVVRLKLGSAPLLNTILKSHSFYFVPSGSTVEVRKEHVCENLLVTIAPRTLEKILPGAVALPMMENMEDEAVTQGAIEFRRKLIVGELDQTTVRDLVQTLLLAFKRKVTVPESSPDMLVLSSLRIKRALDYIEANYTARVSVDEIARAAGDLSPCHFAHAFSSALGRAPYQCVIERKLHQARTLLTETADGIARIAYMVGFSSQAHMTETFTRRIGVTPSQFRRMPSRVAHGAVRAAHQALAAT